MTYITKCPLCSNAISLFYGSFQFQISNNHKNDYCLYESNKKKETIMRSKDVSLLYFWDTTREKTKNHKNMLHEMCKNRKVKDKIATCLLITRYISPSECAFAQ